MIFLSYAQVDKERVRRLAHALESVGYEVWWDEHIQAGKRFERVIEAALERSLAVVVVWTEASAVSEWVYEEAEYGKRANKLVPVYFDDCKAPFGFRVREGARLESWRGDTDHLEWQNLLRSLEPLAGKRSASQQPRPASPSHEKGPSAARSKASNGGSSRQASASGEGRGGDLRYDLSISLEEAFSGGERTFSVPGRMGQGSRELTVNIPPGIESGMRIRLAGEGELDHATNTAGDLYLFVDVADHPIFERDGSDLYSKVRVSMTTCILGGKVTIPTIDTRGALTIPEGTQTGTLLRLRGKGMPSLKGDKSTGHMFVEIIGMIPDDPSEEVKALVRKLADLEEPAAERARTQPAKKRGWFG